MWRRLVSMGTGPGEGWETKLAANRKKSGLFRRLSVEKALRHLSLGRRKWLPPESPCKVTGFKFEVCVGILTNVPRSPVCPACRTVIEKRSPTASSLSIQCSTQNEDLVRGLAWMRSELQQAIKTHALYRRFLFSTTLKKGKGGSTTPRRREEAAPLQRRRRESNTTSKEEEGKQHHPKGRRRQQHQPQKGGGTTAATPE